MKKRITKIPKKIIAVFFKWMNLRTKITVGCGTLIKSSKVKCKGDNNSIEIGNNVILKSCTFTFYGSDNRVVIGDGVKLKDVSFSVEDDGNVIMVGEKTTFFGRCHLAACEGRSLVIGKDCMFSHDIDLRTTDSHSILMDGKRINCAKDITIGNHVWIGLQSLILKGANIPDGCVIGARSIVGSSEMEPNSLYAGAPAKLINRDITWKRERI